MSALPELAQRLDAWESIPQAEIQLHAICEGEAWLLRRCWQACLLVSYRLRPTNQITRWALDPQTWQRHPDAKRREYLATVIAHLRACRRGRYTRIHARELAVLATLERLCGLT